MTSSAYLAPETPLAQNPSLAIRASSTSAQDTVSMTSNSDMASSAMVLYNPMQYQNRDIMPLPTGWTTGSESLTSFPLFQKFPPELRIMIWKLLLPGPQVIIMDAFYNHYGDEESLKMLNLAQRTPALLHTNKEARDIALKIYTRLTVHSSPHDNIPMSKGSKGRYHDAFYKKAVNRVSHQDKIPRRISHLFVDLLNDTLLFAWDGYNEDPRYGLYHDPHIRMEDFGDVRHFALEYSGFHFSVHDFLKDLCDYAETITLLHWAKN